MISLGVTPAPALSTGYMMTRLPDCHAAREWNILAEHRGKSWIGWKCWFALSSHIIMFVFFFPRRIIFFSLGWYAWLFRLLLVYHRRKCSLKKMRCFMMGWKKYLYTFNQWRMNLIKSRKIISKLFQENFQAVSGIH